MGEKPKIKGGFFSGLIAALIVGVPVLLVVAAFVWLVRLILLAFGV